MFKKMVLRKALKADKKKKKKKKKLFYSLFWEKVKY